MNAPVWFRQDCELLRKHSHEWANVSTDSASIYWFMVWNRKHICKRILLHPKRIASGGTDSDSREYEMLRYTLLELTWWRFILCQNVIFRRICAVWPFLFNTKPKKMAWILKDDLNEINITIIMLMFKNEGP